MWATTADAQMLLLALSPGITHGGASATVRDTGDRIWICGVQDKGFTHYATTPSPGSDFLHVGGCRFQPHHHMLPQTSLAVCSLGGTNFTWLKQYKIRHYH